MRISLQILHKECAINKLLSPIKAVIKVRKFNELIMKTNRPMKTVLIQDDFAILLGQIGPNEMF